MSTDYNFSLYLRILRIYFFTLLGAQVGVCLILWFKQQHSADALEFQQDRWLQAIVTITLLMLGVCLFLRKKLIEKANEQPTLQEKLAHYRKALIIIWALIEGANLLNAVCFSLSGRVAFLYIAAAVSLLFVTQIPLRLKIINDLQFNTSEQTLLDDPNTDVMSPP